MLRSLILTFINFYFVDWLVAASLLQAVYGIMLCTLGHTLWYEVLAQLPIGIALAVGCRYVQGRWKNSMLLLTTHVSPDWTWTGFVSLMLAAASIIYPFKVENTGSDSLQTPFAAGTMIFWGAAIVILYVCEGTAYSLEFKRAKFRLFGLYPLCALVVSAIVTVDMLAFKKGYFIVLIIWALMLPMRLL